MTTVNPTTDGGAEIPGGQNRGGRGGRGRGGARGGRGARAGGEFLHQGMPNERGGEAFAERNGEGLNRGRGRGRGRGGAGRGRGNRDRAGSYNQNTSLGDQPDQTTALPPPQPGGAGVSGARLSRDAAGTQGENGGAGGGEDGDDVEAEVCFICASPVSHNSVAPCNHRTCHICALRLRALYKTKACAHCRTEAANVIFTDDAEKRYEDFQPADFYKEEKNLGISYEKAEILEDTVLLLRYNCPDQDCDVACLGWPDLHRHVRSLHQKVMCDLCTRNKKVFTHEHELFTQQELKRHEKFGDDNPGAIDQSGFKGHPECGFCRKRFYGDDELFVHCRERHERCHLCDRRTGGQTPAYFVDYKALEQHFSRDHFPCLDQECQEKKFVVFDSQMDLKAHQLESHPNGMSKDVRRDARRVDLSNFDYRPQYEEPQRGGGRGGRRAGRGRDPNAEHTPAVSSGHLSRAEAAHQREREIHSAQSVSSRSFGGQLSAAPVAQTVTRPATAQRANNFQAPPPTADSGPGSGATSPRIPAEVTALTPQEQARRVRHAAVTERASTLLRNDAAKMNEFRERISAYRRDTLSAGDLIDAFFALFDTSSEELGKLVKELAEIFEIPAKRDSLLRAWGDWKAINEDYPTLPGPAGASSSSASVLGHGVGTSRVLKLKSSTAQSSRSTVGKSASWGTASSSHAASSSNPFPSLPASANAPTPRGAVPGSGWLAIRPAAVSASSSRAASPATSSRPSPAPSRQQSSANLAKNAFPALPAAKKPTSTLFAPGYTGRGVIRNNSHSQAPANAWGGSASETATPVVEESVSTRGNKGKGKKGQVLFQWG